MSLAQLLKPSLTEQFSKKLREKIDRPRFAGAFTSEYPGMRLVKAREKNLCFYWLVDLDDGVIADVKFQAYGPPALIGVGEIACELVLRKNYSQASRITADLLDQHVRDKKDQPAFPKETFTYLNLALSAIDRAAQQCMDIPFVSNYDATPIEYDFAPIPGGIPEWETFPTEQKRKIIEEVIEKEVRPYIELDAGGVKVVDFRKEKDVHISYEGSCTTCHSSTGSTLTAIQQILQSRIHPSLNVIPEL